MSFIGFLGGVCENSGTGEMWLKILERRLIARAYVASGEFFVKRMN